MAGQALTADDRDLVQLLGGARALGASPRSGAELVALVRRGLPYAALKVLTSRLGLSSGEVKETLRFSERTLHRRKGARLTHLESDRLVRLARVTARAGQVLRSADAAARWLRTPNRTLDGAPPIQLLDTDYGTSRVVDVLGRIEHGVYT